MRARWYGWCSRCDDAIRPGDDVVPCTGGYVHAGCASGQDDA